MWINISSLFFEKDGRKKYNSKKKGRPPDSCKPVCSRTSKMLIIPIWLCKRIIYYHRIEREQIVLRQAIRLRQDRITILINKEKQKVKQQTAAVKFA